MRNDTIFWIGLTAIAVYVYMRHRRQVEVKKFSYKEPQKNPNLEYWDRVVVSPTPVNLNAPTNILPLTEFKNAYVVPRNVIF